MAKATDLPIYREAYDLLVLLAKLTQQFPRGYRQGLGMRHYVRYVDDMVIVHPEPKALLAAADVIREHLAGIGMQLAESKTFVAPVEKGVDFVGHVLRPHRRAGRAKTHRNAVRRVMAAPIGDLAVCCNSYLGLYRHVGSRAQREEICRAGQLRGLRFDRGLTKVSFQRRKTA